MAGVATAITRSGCYMMQ